MGSIPTGPTAPTGAFTGRRFLRRRPRPHGAHTSVSRRFRSGVHSVGQGGEVVVEEAVSDSRQLTSPSYTVGTRLLVSGEIPQEETSLQDATVWGCGFTRYYDPTTADAWRTALD